MRHAQASGDPHARRLARQPGDEIVGRSLAGGMARDPPHRIALGDRIEGKPRPSLAVAGERPPSSSTTVAGPERSAGVAWSVTHTSNSRPDEPAGPVADTSEPATRVASLDGQPIDARVLAEVGSLLEREAGESVGREEVKVSL